MVKTEFDDEYVKWTIETEEQPGIVSDMQDLGNNGDTARLISKAPDMLDMLEHAPEPNSGDFVAWLHQYSRWYHDSSKLIAEINGQ